MPTWNLFLWFEVQVYRKIKDSVGSGFRSANIGILMIYLHSCLDPMWKTIWDYIYVSSKVFNFAFDAVLCSDRRSKPHLHDTVCILWWHHPSCGIQYIIKAIPHSSGSRDFIHERGKDEGLKTTASRWKTKHFWDERLKWKGFKT